VITSDPKKKPIPKFKLGEIDFSRPSVMALLAANVVPLLGVLFLGWSTFAIVVLYWSENVIIGAINVLKMMVCCPTEEAINLANVSAEQLEGNSRQVSKLLEQQAPRQAFAHQASKLFFIPFFIFHYGLFCFGHGEFIFTMLGNQGMSFGGPLEVLPEFFDRLRAEGLTWALLALTASHLFSFFTNFIGRGEYRRVTVPLLMFQPYGRIVVMHIAILFGAFLIEALGSPVWMLVILIIGKTIMDLGLHMLQRQEDGKQPESPPILTTN
jgi:hypothetical protein